MKKLVGYAFFAYFWGVAKASDSFSNFKEIKD